MQQHKRIGDKPAMYKPSTYTERFMFFNLTFASIKVKIHTFTILACIKYTGS